MLNAPNSIPTVFIVDPDPSVRALLEMPIRRSGWRALGFASAEGFLASSRLEVPTCLLFELSPDSIMLQQRIVLERNETPLIAICGEADIPLTVRAMRAGAFELLVKPLGMESLLTAVENALARSGDALRQEMERVVLRRRYDSLSSREREVMARVVTGHLNKQVGGALGISEITVKAHRGRAMRKMGAGSLAELVGMALSLGLRLGAPPYASRAPTASSRLRPAELRAASV